MNGFVYQTKNRFQVDMWMHLNFNTAASCILSHPDVQTNGYAVVIFTQPFVHSIDPPPHIFFLCYVDYKY